MANYVHVKLVYGYGDSEEDFVSCGSDESLHGQVENDSTEKGMSAIQ